MDNSDKSNIESIVESLVKTFKSQSKNFFKMMYSNEKINKHFTSFYFILSKKFIKLQPIKSMELVVKYTHKHYNELMTFNENLKKIF